MPWKPTLKQLEIILLTARLGNLTRVAASLNITQPAISQNIKEIEKNLGYSLFIRGPRGLHPSPSTLQFLAQAERVHEQIVALGEQMRSQHTEGRPSLRLAALNSISATLVPRALQAYRVDHNAIEVTSLVASGAEINDMMGRQEIDCALVYAGIDSPLTNGVAIMETEVACFSMKPEQKSRLRGGVKMTDLAEKAIILPTHDTVMGEIIRQNIQDTGPSVSMMNVNSAFSAIGLVREGLGSALVDPLLICHNHTRGLCVRCLDPSIGLRVDLLFGRNRMKEGLVTNFLPYLQSAAQTVARTLEKASIRTRLC